MATSVQPSPSTTLTPTDTRKPTINVSGDSAVIQAITLNKEFPDPPADIRVAELNAQASTGGNFNLPGINDAPVSFNVSASATAGLAAYQTPSQLEADLGFASEDGKQLNVSFPENTNQRFLVVRCGFDISGKVSGNMALNPAVNVSFGASGKGDGLFAFVAAVDKSVHAQDAFVKLLDSWCSPAEIASDSSKLAKGCWVVTEVTGELSANLGVTAGYDFNWVKTLKLNDLEGDIGLRISLGLNAMLTARLGGKYYLVLNRDLDSASNPGVRLRLFRATTKGLGFALHAGANITPSTGTLTPDKLDDFIAAILGIHNTHLLALLHSTDIKDITNALGDKFLADLGVDENAAFATLQNFFAKWDALPQTVTSVIWKYADDIPGLTKIEHAAQKLANLQQSDVKDFLDGLLHDASFHEDPTVQWLEATASEGLFELYESDRFDKLRDDAKKLAAVLDGSALQDFLTKLQAKVNTTLSLANLEQALNSGDLSGVAVWVTEQLAKFAGVDLTQLKASIGKINAAIKTIRDKSQAIYAATVKALNTTYGFSLDFAYNASSTESALIDAVFADTANGSLADAISGDFSQIFAARIPGVTLNTCTLAHAIRRDTHVETHLPWSTGISDDLATGYTNAILADSDSGRVQFFEAGGTDAVSSETVRRNANLKRFASCSIGVSGKAQGVHQYNVSAVDFGYSFVTVGAPLSRAQFEYEYGAAAGRYFPRIFGAENPNPNHGTFDTWVSDWDTFTAQVSGTPNGIIGNAWVNLQVRRRAQAGFDWVSALLNNTGAPDYRAMSFAMQTNIRRFLLAAYASDPSNFKDVPKGNPGISAFLVYTALPAMNDVILDGSLLKQNPKGAIVWDVRDLNLVTAITNTFTPVSLKTNFVGIQTLLQGVPELKNTANFYDSVAAQQAIQLVAGQPLVTDPYVTLLENEKAVIDGAQAAFEKLRKTGNQPLVQSLPTFSNALISLVEDFNKNLSDLSLDSPQVMRLFAPLVFQAAVDAMFGQSGTFPLEATLDVAVLKGAALPDADQPPDPGDTLLRQHITSFA
ncbi:MAG TPA: hypothetical protein VJN89_21910 [Candidatus Acidoferrum sp.]|nr:hypothetical protein [Candidatus Acidoferrum sp.]